MKNTKRGFTIVELVIVIAVIAILAAILIPVFSNVIETANESALKAEIKNAYSGFVSEKALDNATYNDQDEYAYKNADGVVYVFDANGKIVTSNKTFTADALFSGEGAPTDISGYVVGTVAN